MVENSRTATPPFNTFDASCLSVLYFLFPGVEVNNGFTFTFQFTRTFLFSAVLYSAFVL